VRYFRRPERAPLMTSNSSIRDAERQQALSPERNRPIGVRHQRQLQHRLSEAKRWASGRLMMFVDSARRKSEEAEKNRPWTSARPFSFKQSAKPIGSPQETRYLTRWPNSGQAPGPPRRFRRCVRIPSWPSEPCRPLYMPVFKSRDGADGAIRRNPCPRHRSASSGASAERRMPRRGGRCFFSTGNGHVGIL